MPQQRIPIVWIIAAAALFALLLGARAVLDSVSSSGPDVQGAYGELAAALQQDGLLPLGADDGFLLSLVSLARDRNAVFPKDEPATSGDIIVLGDVIEARSADRRIVQLTLRPQFQSELRPGALPAALRKLAGISTKAQMEAGLAMTNRQAQFEVTVEQESYYCQTSYSGGSVDEVVIMRK